MADSRFFQSSGPFTLAQIAEWSGARLPDGTDSSQTFQNVAALDVATADEVSFLDNVKYAEQFEQTKAGACFIRKKFLDRAPKGMIPLIHEDPYRCFAMTAQRFYPASTGNGEISPHATVADSANIGDNCTIEAGAVIGENVEVGNSTLIAANATIHAGCTIGNHCHIGSNTTISHTLMADRVTIHSGVQIGQDGFGFAMGAGGHVKVPQLGRVIIESDVEIGAGSCIDRGAGPDTIIGEGTKIDNLVQIGHNVKIGNHVVIVSQSGISGSTQIDDYVVIGGQVGVAGHLNIGPGAQLAARTGVTQDLEPGKIYGGTPAMPIRDWHRQTVALNELIKKKRRNA